MTHVSLFSGIGGLDLAAEWAGFETVLFCERDQYCQKVLRKHWPDVPIIDDIREVNSESVREPIDVISGGFPCQPFSHAGKRRGTGDDRFLWPEMLRVIREIKPRFIVAENVPGLLSIESGMVFERVLSEMESIGYEVFPLHYPAAGVGAPHRRDRVFIIAYARYATGEGERQRKQKVSKELGASGKRRVHAETVGYSGLLGQEKRKEQTARIEQSSQDVADAGCEHGTRNTSRMEAGTTERTTGKLPAQSSGKGYRENHWESESDVGRVAHGIPRRVDRLRALGNAVVPQQAYPIFKAIAELREKLGII